MQAKRIERHPNYIINEFGYVYREYIRNGEEYLYYLKPDISNGYPRVDIDGKKEYIARLVLEAFKPPIDSRMRVFYIDGDKLNTKLENLCWLSPSDIQLYSQYTVEYRKQLFAQW